MKTKQSLIGKRISITRHHDSFPSDYTGGTITSIEKGKVFFTTSEGKEEDRDLCSRKLECLLESGEYTSDYMWSRSSEAYYIFDK